MSVVDNSFTEDDKARTWTDLTFEDVKRFSEPLLERLEAEKEQHLDEEQHGPQEEAWEAFYRQHEENFFKNRAWLLRDFPQLAQVRGRLLECGCGVGNTIWPLMEALPRVDHFVGFDLSETAVQLLRDRGEGRVEAFAWDASREEPVQVPGGPVNIITMIFFLSALRAEQIAGVVRRIAEHLEEGGVVVFRDYAEFDMTQVRFARKGHRKFAERTYARADGTSTYFLRLEEVREAFAGAGLEPEVLRYEARELRNRKTSERMYRNWITGYFRKPPRFNGISVSEIERRARPLEDRLQDPDSYKFRSSSGFLGEEESFLERLRADDVLVRDQLQTTHEALAALLDQHMESGERRFYAGHQRSLFYNPDSPDEQDEWNEEWLVRARGFKMIVTRASIRWIRKWGFYQGDTPYRLDPRCVYAALAEDPPPHVQQLGAQYLAERRQAKRERREAALAELQREWAQVGAEGDAFFGAQIAKLRRKLDVV